MSHNPAHNLQENSQNGWRAQRRLGILAAVIILLTISALLVVQRMDWPRHAPQVADFRNVAPDIDERIQKTQVKPLLAETPEQSVRNPRRTPQVPDFRSVAPDIDERIQNSQV